MRIGCAFLDAQSHVLQTGGFVKNAHPMRIFRCASQMRILVTKDAIYYPYMKQFSPFTGGQEHPVTEAIYHPYMRQHQPQQQFSPLKNI